MDTQTPNITSSEEKHKDSLMGDIKSFQANSLSAKLVVLIILVSTVAGALGGAVGLSYFGNSPWLAKYLPKAAGEPQVEKVVLNEESAVVETVKKASPAVVSIVVSKDLNKFQSYSASPFFDDPFFQLFGLGLQEEQQQAPTEPNIQQVSAGTGFFVSKDGTILTNKHVVSDTSASYSVVTNEGKTYDAKVLSTDPVNDLAILKVEIENAPVLELANSSDLQVGQRVVAIGNSLGQYQNTVTTGVVSGIGRSIVAGSRTGSEQLQGVIQTDAAINPGNSGGPLLNILGQVVGVNTAIDNQGQLVGFAIPASDVQRALDSFKKYGKITRPFLGVRYALINKDIASRQKLPKDYGALIIKGQTQNDLAVIPGSPADKAGITENDIILEVDSIKIDDKHSLAFLLSKYEIGDTVTLKVYTKGNEKEIKVKLEESK